MKVIAPAIESELSLWAGFYALKSYRSTIKRLEIEPLENGIRQLNLYVSPINQWEMRSELRAIGEHFIDFCQFELIALWTLDRSGVMSWVDDARIKRSEKTEVKNHGY